MPESSRVFLYSFQSNPIRFHEKFNENLKLKTQEFHPRVLIHEAQLTSEIVQFVSNKNQFLNYYVLVSDSYVPFLHDILRSMGRKKPRVNKVAEVMQSQIVMKPSLVNVMTIDPDNIAWTEIPTQKEWGSFAQRSAKKRKKTPRSRKKSQSHRKRRV